MNDGLLAGVRVGPPAHGGHCVARVEGRVVFVRHAAPGELVDVRLTEAGDGKRFWRGDAVTVHEASPDRRAHVWAQAGPGGVGGGELGHLTLAAQRRWKADVVTDALRRIGHLDLTQTPVGSVDVEALPGDEESDGLGTRSRISVVVDGDGNAAMYRHRSHETVPLRDMPLAAPGIAELDPFARGRWADVEPGTRLALVAPSVGDPLVVDGAGRVAVRERVELSQHMPRPAVLEYTVDADGFWQIHRQAPAALVGAVLGALDVNAGQRVVELYSGAGLFTVPLAEAVGEDGRVEAFEADAGAVAHAGQNLGRRTQAVVHRRRVDAHTVRSLAAERGGRPDAVVLDPPRSGAGQDVMRAIAELGAPRVCYVACDPAALARDLAVALDSGYRLTALRGLDLFPHTHHVECVAVLQKTA